MPSVGDLFGLRRALPAGVGIADRPIPAHKLDRRVVAGWKVSPMARELGCDRKTVQNDLVRHRQKRIRRGRLIPVSSTTLSRYCNVSGKTVSIAAPSSGTP